MQSWKRLENWRYALISCNTSLPLTSTGWTLDPQNELILFIRDALRSISAFIILISRSAPRIYLSALPFSPECSLVDEKFRPRSPNTLTASPLNGQWLFLLQNTTRILHGALSCRGMKRPLLPSRDFRDLRLCMSAILKQ